MPDHPSPETPTIGPDDVRKIAALARLHVSDAEIDALVEHFGKMMHFVEHLADADDPECEPFRLDPRPAETLREDVTLPPGEPGASTPRELWQRNAPETEGPYFTVPRVVG